jgi:DNA polymerase III subunit gamma/tau
MLGTVRGGALEKLASHVVARDAAEALAEVDRALGEGVDVGQLAEQLLGYFRDMMAAAVGCGEELMLHTLAADQPKLRAAAEQMGLETILAVVQIFDQAVVRMRQSTHGRVLLEMAIVRSCCLENLDELSSLVVQLRDGAPASSLPARSARPAAAPEKKNAHGNGHPAAPLSQSETARTPEAAAPRLELTAENAISVWNAVVEQVSGLTAGFAKMAAAVAISAPNRLVISFPENYNFQKEQCERVEHKQKLEQAFRSMVGTTVALTFDASAPPCREGQGENVRRGPSRQQRIAELRSHALVSEAIQLFEAEILKAD